MPPFLSIGCMIAAVVVLIVLSVIDLRTRLLPNIWVTTFAGLGILFHWSAGGAYLGPAAVMLGGLAGFGTLFAIRAVANHLYKQDALGLGDVKLAAVVGASCGTSALAAAPLAIAVAAIAAAATGLLTRRTRLPLGPSLWAGWAVATAAAGAGWAAGGAW